MLERPAPAGKPGCKDEPRFVKTQARSVSDLIGSSLSRGCYLIVGFGFLEEAVAEAGAGVEDLGVDEAVVFPVHGDEPADAGWRGGLEGAARGERVTGGEPVRSTPRIPHPRAPGNDLNKLPNMSVPYRARQITAPARRRSSSVRPPHWGGALIAA
jgi:hypothetical protein